MALRRNGCSVVNARDLRGLLEDVRDGNAAIVEALAHRGYAQVNRMARGGVENGAGDSPRTPVAEGET